MQANSACGLFAAGAAFLMQKKFLRISMSLSLIVFTIGFLTACEHLFGIDLLIDHLLDMGSADVYQNAPGRMALITAVSLIFIGGTQFIFNFVRPNEARYMLVAFIAALPGAIGTAAFICYLFHLGPSTQISSFARMAPATAAGVGILGISNLWLIWSKLKRETNSSFKVLPLISFFIFSLFSVLVWQISLGMERKSTLDSLSVFVHEKAAGVVSRLEQTSDALKRYSSRLEIIGLSNKTYLELDSKNYIDQLKIISRIGIADRSFKVFWSYPKELHKQISGYNQSTDPLRRRAFAGAATSGEPTMSQTVELKSGGLGALIVIPPSRNSGAQRFIYATVNYNKLFASIFDPQSFFVRIIEGDEVVFNTSAESRAEFKDLIQTDVNFGYNRLVLQVAPTQAFLSSHSSHTPNFVLIFSGILAILLTMLSWSWANFAHEKSEFNRISAENLDRLNVALETSNIAGWSVELATGAVWRSAFHDSVFGYESRLPEWNQELFYSHVHPIDLEKVRHSQEQLPRDGKPFELEFRILTAKSKTIRWLKLVGVVANNADGNPIRLRGTIRDISVEKQNETERAYDLEWRKALLNGSDYSIISTDKSGTIVTFNRGAEILLEYPGSEMVGKQTPAIIHDKDEVLARSNVLTGELGREIKPGFDVFVAKTLVDGVPDENNWTYITKSGKRLTVRLSVTPIRTPDGVVQGFLGVAKDITAELTARQEFQTTLDRLERVVVSTGEGIWERSFDSKEIQYLNQECKRIFGFPDDHNPTYQEVTERIVPSELPKIQEKLDLHLADPTTGFDFEFKIRPNERSGSEKWIRAKGRVTFQGNRPDRLVSTLSDVTETVHARLQLQQALEDAKIAVSAKSAFLASMSHEIRTPLNGIIGMTDLILDSRLSDDQRNFAEVAQQSGLSLLALINDILDFSKIEAGKMELEQSELNLAQVVENQLDILIVKAVQNNITIASFVSPKIPINLLGDSGRLGQILLNLIGNAIKFTNIGGVSIKVYLTPSNTIRFEVQDQGIGISPEGISKLFQPFSQADASICNKFGGTGLGLSICKRLVDAMEGKIGVESELGQGALFWFEIPLKATALHPTSVPLHEAFRGVSTLLLEGDPIVKEVLNNYLYSFEMRSETVATPEEVFSLLSAKQNGENPYRILFLSSSMGLQAASDLAAQVTNEYAEVSPRLIYISDFGATIDRTQLISRGFSTVLRKPIKQSQLLNTLGEVLDVRPKNRHVPKVEIEVSEKSASAKHAKKRVLVAEDVPGNQLLVRKMLEKLGYKPTVVSNGIEVLDTLTKFPFDIVLMDCQMPEMDGFEATSCIRALEDENLRKIRIVALTANALDGDAKRCIAAGMDDYMSKPMKLDQLGNMLAKWLSTEADSKAA